MPRRRFWRLFAVFCALAGIIYLILWLTLWRLMRLPSYNVAEFRLDGLDESIASLKLNTVTSFRIETRNGGAGQMVLYYDNFKVFVGRVGKIGTDLQLFNLGRGEVPGFRQLGKNTTTIVGKFLSIPQDLPLRLEDKTAILEAFVKGELGPLVISLSVRTSYKDATGFKSRKFDASIECRLKINPQIVTGSQIVDQVCEVQRFQCLTGHDCRMD